GTGRKGRKGYKRCARKVLKTLVATGALRAQCNATVRRMTTKSVCGYKRKSNPVVCLRESLVTGALSCGISLPASACKNTPGVSTATRCSAATHCFDAADSNGDLRIAMPGDSGRCSSAPAP